jgi:octaprenyl-diphosphate synthase
MLTADNKKKDSPSSLSTMIAPIQYSMDLLDAFLEEQINAFEPKIRPVITYCIQNKGKRIRPILLFYSAYKGGVSKDKKLICIAAVLELVHLATLVHDDVLDEAAYRHNCKTLYKKYGTKISILLGDALFAHALKLASDFSGVDVCRTVSKAICQVCSGEISQTLNQDSPSLDIKTYLRIIDLKTAELFHVSCSLGSALAGYDATFVQATGTFGRYLGRAYQIYDDLADLLGNEKQMGKTLGTDIITGKLTLPILLLLEKVDSAQSRELKQKIKNKKNDHFIKELNTFLAQEKIFESVYNYFKHEIEHARKSLEPFSNYSPTEHLLKLSYLIENTFCNTLPAAVL